MTPALWLIGADVPLDVYGGEQLEQALSNLDWVGNIAIAHEQVVEHFTAKRGLTIIPMKLFTMFSSVNRAAGDIKRRRSTIEGVMRKVAGCEEWGVRVLRGSTEDARTETGTSVRAASGAAFLAAKKQARDSARESRLAAATAALAAFEELAAIAKDARRRQDAPAAGATPPLLDAAFLVPAGKRAAFNRAARREAAACAAAGAQMTLSGPWPAYNFVQVSEPSR